MHNSRYLLPSQMSAEAIRLKAGSFCAGTSSTLTRFVSSRVQDGDLEGCLQRALDAGADIIVSSGGVSMGDRDLIKPMLEREGKVHFGRVSMKPGKPLTYATMQPTPSRQVQFFGLPGASSGCPCRF